jgi:hypothetical protein
MHKLMHSKRMGFPDCLTLRRPTVNVSLTKINDDEGPLGYIVYILIAEMTTR